MTRRAQRDATVFAHALADIPVPVTVVEAQTTSAFSLDYDGEQRTMRVDAVGDPWSTTVLDGAGIDTAWVHLAALLRGEFPAEAIAHLDAAGHRISLDGQGLVRLARPGPMRVDDEYDPDILARLSVLKLADDEATVLAGGEFTEATALALGVPEILVTFGSAGADLYVDGARAHVNAPRRVTGVHTTGSGDMFAVSYAAARAAGAEPIDAARAACELVAEVLERRLADQRG